MGKTLKKIADEIGVSKQAVYKRLKGKLKNVCAPYVYTEYNRTCLTEEGEAIIKKDFEENPCATPLFDDFSNSAVMQPNNTERSVSYTSDIRNTYGQNPYVHTEQPTAPHTEHIPNAYAADMEHSVLNTTDAQNAYGQNPYEHTDATTSTYGANTEHSRNISDLHTEQVNKSVSDMEHIGSTSQIESSPNTEHIRSTYGANAPNTNNIRNDSVSDTDTHTDETAELKEKLHQMEIKLVKANAEIENKNVRIESLQERISDKDRQIAEQRESIARIDGERKLLTISLFKNNQFLEEIMKLPLSKRIFGWNQVQKRLKDTQNLSEQDVTNDNAVVAIHNPDDTDAD